MISIVIPAYNAGKTIERCIDSLQSQRIEGDYEIIVVDDGSTDDTAGRVKRASDKDKRIRLLRQVNSGPAIARNNGALAAGGNLVCFIDSDCEATSSWLGEITKPFSDPLVFACQGAYKTRQTSLAARFVQLEVLERYERMKKAKVLDWVGSYSAAYRKEVFTKKGFDTDFPRASGEDPELSYRISKEGKKIVFNEKAIVYHRHPESFTDYLGKKFTHAYYRITLYSKHKDKIINDSYTPQALKLQIIAATLILFSALLLLVSIISENFMQYLIGITLGLIFVFLITALPSTVFNLKRDFAIGVITPFVLFARSIAFAAGLFLGMLEKVFG